MATAIPKGSESTIAPILTSNVPNNKGINPNIGAGVEVGYHFVPPKNSPNVIQFADLLRDVLKFVAQFLLRIIVGQIGETEYQDILIHPADIFPVGYITVENVHDLLR